MLVSHTLHTFIRQDVNFQKVIRDRKDKNLMLKKQANPTNSTEKRDGNTGEKFRFSEN